MNRKRLAGLMYALSYLGISIVGQTTVKWYQYYYTPPEMNQDGLRVLVPLSLIGVAMIIGRIFDGISDPLVAYLSDNSKSRLGRRIPFILYGTIPLIATFILIWFPPVQGESIWNFVYLSLMLSLFFIFFTIVVAPYLALIGEITRTKEERINLTMMMGITQIIGVMIAEAGSAALIAMSNYKVMGLVLGLISLVTIILTPIFVREEERKPLEGKPTGFFKSMKRTLENKNFVYYLIPQLAIWFGINTLSIAMPYICEILLGMKAESSGLMVGGAFVLAALFSPFLPRITLKYGKKQTLLVATVMFGFLLLAVGLFGTVFQGVAAIVIVVLVGIPLAASFVIANAMVADIAEVDGIIHGEKREGMFFGTQGLFNKFVIGFSSVITPWLFHTFGYSVIRPLGLQLCGPIAGVCVLTGAFFLHKYTLTEDIREVNNAQRAI